MVSLNEGCDGPLGTRRCHAVLQAFRGPRKKASKASASPQKAFRASGGLKSHESPFTPLKPAPGAKQRHFRTRPKSINHLERRSAPPGL